jgi:hypothetical protein
LDGATEIREPSALTLSAHSSAASLAAAAEDAQAAAAELRWIRSFLQQPQWTAEAEAQPTAVTKPMARAATDLFAALASEVESPTTIAAAVPISPSSSSGGSSDGAFPSSLSSRLETPSHLPASDRERDWQLLTEAAMQMEEEESAAAADGGSTEQP